MIVMQLSTLFNTGTLFCVVWIGGPWIVDT